MSRHRSAQRYWDAYEATLEPPADAAARNLARIEARLAAGESVDDEAPATAAAPRRAAAGVALIGKSAAISMGIATATLLSIKLAVMGWSQLVGPASPPAEPAVERTTRAARIEAASPPSADAPSPSSPVAEPAAALPPAPLAPAPDSRATERPRRTQAPALDDRLRAEVALMDRARAALERDDAAALLRLTDEHARRFPAGALVEERQAWQAIASCRLGHATASAQADRFLRAYPRSAQADKVRRACEVARNNR